MGHAGTQSSQAEGVTPGLTVSLSVVAEFILRGDKRVRGREAPC